jgi:hypothetical protein
MNIARTFAFAAVTAFMTVGTALAAPTPAEVVGTGSLAWSSELVIVSPSILRIRVPSVIPVMEGISGGGETNTAAYDVGTHTVNLVFNQSSASGNATSFLAADSYVHLYTLMSYTDMDDELIGTSVRSILLKNLEVNLGDASLYADLYTVYQSPVFAATSPVVTSFGRQAIFSGHVSGNTIDSLRLTQTAVNPVMYGLFTEPDQDLSPTIRQAFAPMVWGSVTATLSTSAVPESGTFALMAMGLLLIGGARQAQARKRATPAL